jgi:hypothetical protein
MAVRAVYVPPKRSFHPGLGGAPVRLRLVSMAVRAVYVPPKLSFHPGLGGALVR